MFSRIFGRARAGVEPPQRDETPPDPAPDFVAIDVETACRRRGSICQIGLVGFRDGRECFALDYLVDPKDAFEARNIEIHGIDAARVRGSPHFGRLHTELNDRLAGRFAVHHSPFDRQAIGAACEDYGRPAIAARWLDSVAVARRAWPDLANHKLPLLAAHLGLTLRHHDAVSDARVAGRIVLMAQAELGMTLAELSVARRPPVAVREARIRREPEGDGAFSGDSVVMTGGFAQGKDALAAAIAAQGGQVRASVSRKTTLLVLGIQDPTTFAGKSKSSKHLEVEAMIAAGRPVAIISEAQLLARLGRDL